MLLTKSCYKKDHIKTRETVKLATLDHYRKTENEETRDEDEGRVNFEILIETPIWIEKRWFNTVMTDIQIGGGPETYPVRFPGRSRITAKGMRILEQTESHALISPSRIYVEREAPECLIFCMSMARKIDECRGIFPKYDDQWHLRETSAGIFAQEMARSLYDLLGSPGRTDYIHPSIPHEEIVVNCRHEPVIYTDRVIRISNNSKLDINTILDHMNFMSFIKPARYSRENEYRFLYYIVHKNNILKLNKDEVILPLPGHFIQRTF